ncbi:MAG: photosystem reaction center subunit [Verrucomicrobiales bacterium]|nr:photosystem reaction center subunit [Verrucomicrobiales bacterium]
MKLSIIKYAGLITVSGLLTLGGANLLAQSDQDSSQQTSKDKKQESKDSKKEQGRTTEASKDELKVSPEQLSKNVTDANKASKIIGMQVKNTQNEDLGKVKELVIDTHSGKVAYAVLSAGGGMVGGGKLVAVPFEALSLQPGAKNLVMNIKKDEFKNSKGFADKNWPSLDAVKSGQTVGIASKGGQSDQNQATGGSGSGSQKSEGSSQSSTNKSSSSSSDQPAKSDDKSSDSGSSKSSDSSSKSSDSSK